MILSEKHKALQKSFREFAQREFTAELLARLDDTGEFDRDIYEKMAREGFTGLRIPQRYGGRGEDMLAQVLMTEEFARVSPVLSIYANTPNTLGAGTLMACASERQREKYLPGMAAGREIPAFCLTEPEAGSDAGGIGTEARDCGEYYLLNGKKRFVSGAGVADHALVFARTDPSAHGARGISLFMVDMNAPGVSRGAAEDKLGMRGYPTGDVSFQNVKVPKEALIGEQHGGFSAAMKALDGGRLGIAAQAVGIAQGCLDEAVSYARERKQFGKAIGSFEGVSFMLAELATRLEAARELVYGAAQLYDAGSPEAPVRCAMAKYFAAEMCNDAAYKAVQIFGGYGYIKGCRVERLFRDARITSIYEGTSQIQQMVIARELLGKPDARCVEPADGEDICAMARRVGKMLRERGAAAKGNVTVAVGMGIKSDNCRGITLARELAEALGGTLGCTRDVADAGWLEKECVIGQMGKTVQPEVYIALGVSGAAQHLCGVKNARYTVSVNSSPDAAVNRAADSALCGDLFEIVPELIKAIKNEI